MKKIEKNKIQIWMNIHIPDNILIEFNNQLERWKDYHKYKPVTITDLEFIYYLTKIVKNENKN